MNKKLLTKAICFLMVIMLALPASLAAFVTVNASESLSGTCGTDITWVLSEDRTQLTISGTGAMTSAPFFSYTPSGDNAEAEIEEIIIGNQITSIYDYSFRGYINLKSVTIPSSVKTIGKGAFEGCTLLKNVTFNDGLQEIGREAFLDCPALREATIPESVTKIGSYAFNGTSDNSTEIGKDEYDYTAYENPFTMKGYINTEAEDYASSSSYNIIFEAIGGDISKCYMYVSPSSFEYDGLAKTPTVKLQTCESFMYLEATTDYTVSYSNNIDIGTATVTATGAGKFTGTITKTFTIKDPNSTTGGVSEEVVYKAIEMLEAYGFDPYEITNAESEEVAYAIATEYAMRLAELDASFDGITAKDLVEALRGNNSSGGNGTTIPEDNVSTGGDTSTDGNTGTQQPSVHKHNYTYKSNDDATVLKDGTKTGTCTCGDKNLVEDTGSKLKASIKVPAKSFAMKAKQAYKGFKVTMGKGDFIKSVKSNNTKLVKVSKINKTKGTFTLTAQKKTGKAKVTITLASGKKQTLTITVQKRDVKTTKISGLKSKITLKKGKSTTLKPVITPITSKQKVKFKTSNKKIATVSSKGVIKAKKKGKTTITVTSGSKKKTVKVTVN